MVAHWQLYSAASCALQVPTAAPQNQHVAAAVLCCAVHNYPAHDLQSAAATIHIPQVRDLPPDELHARVVAATTWSRNYHTQGRRGRNGCGHQVLPWHHMCTRLRCITPPEHAVPINQRASHGSMSHGSMSHDTRLHTFPPLCCRQPAA